MLSDPIRRVCLSVCVFAVVFAVCIQPSAAKPNIEGKVVLANLDRYDVTMRFGETRRNVKPRKASVLTPKKYPVTIEFWSGNTKGSWKKQTIDAAGVYGFNFKRGNWMLGPLKQGKTVRAAKPLTRQAAQQRVVRPQKVRRSARGTPINADRRRWSPLARAAWIAGSIYQFVRDEKDRDMLRELLIRGRLEDVKELDRWLDDSKIALPHKEELREAFDELKGLSDADWKEIETADEKDWQQAKDDLGDLVSDEDWKNATEDLAEIDTKDFWEDNVDVDLDQVELADNLDTDGDGDIDIGDDLDVQEDIDVGDVGIEADNYDLSSYDDHGAYDGYDAGSFEGGGFEGGGFDGGGFIGDNDFGDFGGDDFGGDFGGGDFGGDDFGGDDF